MGRTGLQGPRMKSPRFGLWYETSGSEAPPKHVWRGVKGGAAVYEVGDATHTTCPSCGEAVSVPGVCVCGLGIPRGTEPDWVRHRNASERKGTGL